MEKSHQNLEEPADSLIDRAVAKAGSFDKLGHRLAYEVRTLRRVRSGEIKMSDKLRTQLERYLQEGIAEGVPNYGKSNVESIPVKLREIPVFTFVQAGEATDYQGLPTSWGDTIGYDGADEKAFALRVAGDSMMPNYPPGTIITVSPKHPPHGGQLVVAKIKDEGVIFKLFHHSGDGRIVTLTSYNDRLYPPIELPREKLDWLYRVVGAYQKL